MEENSKIKDFTDLETWRKSHELALAIYKATQKFPRSETFGLVSQIQRAAVSITSNIAEGFGKYRGKEYGRFLQMALGSARETEYWLELLSDIYPNLKPDIDNILLLNEETIKMLVATVRKLRN